MVLGERVSAFFGIWVSEIKPTVFVGSCFGGSLLTSTVPAYILVCAS